MKILAILPCICLLSLLAGCAPDMTDAPGGNIRAVYLAPPEGGVLSDADLAACLDVTVVRSMQRLKQAATSGAAVWVDRDAADMVDMAWLRSLNTPIVVAGCGDGLYAFASLLDFPIEVPPGTQMDTDAQGFCVWVTVKEKNGFLSQRMKGYQDTPVTPEVIFSAIDEVLGKQSQE